MCGILGQTGKRLHTDAAFGSMQHRGPDGSGEFEEDGVYLAHRRLAIIDISDRGRQPMSSANGDIVISFNGEIYNYRELRRDLESGGVHFVTESDTETIIHGYEKEGVAFFSRMRGMWAFALYDARAGHIILSRDYFGIKPLLYSTQGNEFSFASEMRAMRKLLEVVSPNTGSYYQFFNLGYFLNDETCYQEVKRVLPGEVLTWDIGRKTLTREQLKEPEATDRILAFDEAVHAVDASLCSSIEAHFVSDVSVGLLLSGGNDSSLIAALSAAAGRKPVCYTLEIQGSIDASYAQRIAKHLDLPHERVEMTAAMFAEGYAQALEVLDEPFADSSIIPTSLIYRAMRGKTKVVLSGEGGDELFGGYTRHRWFAELRSIRARAAFNLFPAYGTTALSVSVVNPALSRVRRAIETYSGDLVGTYLSNVRLMDFPIAEKSIRKLLVGAYESATRATLKDPPNLFFDRALYLTNDLLYKTDMASMASSIEARVPFLDRDVLATIRSLDSRFALSPEYTDKLILKKVAERYLPKELVYRPKKGFGFSHDVYASDAFTGDVGTALEFHRAHAGEFGLEDERVRDLLRAKNAGMFVKKYPAFAFALVSNWHIFRK